VNAPLDPSAQTTGFTWTANPDARVLVLGTMPGKTSLDVAEYYAHRGNRSWRIVEQLCTVPGTPGADAPWPDTYSGRLERALAGGLALWDVLAECYRPGSTDAKIRKPIANNFGDFLDQHKRLRAVYFNGKSAEKLWLRHVARGLQPEQLSLVKRALPSTSQAYTFQSSDRLIEEWVTELRPWLKPG
jgi:hypoxanthine-DNA glycosylase